MFFFIFGMTMLTFSGWQFYTSAAKAGKNIEAKIGFAAGGVALFIALIEILPKLFSGILKTSSFSVYQEPYSYIFFLVCGGLVVAASWGVRRFLQTMPESFLSDPQRSTAHVSSDSQQAGAYENEILDRTIRATSIAFLVFAGLAGGASRWAGEADKLPFLMWLFTLPALAVWFGRRSPTLGQAVKQGMIFGAVFVFPSFLFFWSRNFGSNLTAILFSIGSPAIIAAIAFTTRGEAITAASTDKQIKSRADNLMLGSLLGIILPQFFQPAVFDEIRTFNAVSKELGKEEIKQSVSIPSLISSIFLGLTAVISVFAIVIAASDAL